MYLPKVKNLTLLAPLSGLYGLGVCVRNKLFDCGQLKSTSFEDIVPVICVGNLAVGGTGKTPHTEYLVNLLHRHGYSTIAVLSRGYKRRSEGYHVAMPREGKETDGKINAALLGDEPYQLYRKFPFLIVAVDANRVHGINELLKLPTPPQVIILDDAMQHRHVKPGLTICLSSYNRILYKDMLMPAGRLREPMSSISRADMIVVTKCPKALRSEEETEILANLPTRIDQPVLYSAYRYGTFVNLDTLEECDIDHSTEVLIVAGIADPRAMEEYVHTHYRLLDIINYGDHHQFTDKDIETIKARLDGVNGKGYVSNDSGSKAVIITTEKDAARLVHHPAVNDELRKRIYYLPTEVYFLKNHADKFDKIVLDYVRKPRAGIVKGSNLTIGK
jgi:tetraacyldisaccharide 4'-kinase